MEWNYVIWKRELLDAAVKAGMKVFQVAYGLCGESHLVSVRSKGFALLPVSVSPECVLFFLCCYCELEPCGLQWPNWVQISHLNNVGGIFVQPG